jgi:hypothetical protein
MTLSIWLYCIGDRSSGICSVYISVSLTNRTIVLVNPDPCSIVVAKVAHDYSRLLITAAVNSDVVEEPNREDDELGSSLKVLNNDLPPMSAVLTLPALRTWKVAEAMLLAI